MNSKAPQIGFDRFIHLDWVTAAIKYRADLSDIDELHALLDAAELGVAARKKTKTVLNRLWLEPRPELFDFANRGIEIYKANANISTSALTWGMAIATYPFFGKVAELVGRLSAIQGDCTSAEVHRRMSEIYGEREGTSRMTNMVLQSQSNWGAIDREEKGKRLVRRKAVVLDDKQLISWILEAVLRYAGKSLPLDSLTSNPVIYPFSFNESLGHLISMTPNLELVSSGNRDQHVHVVSATA
jgi:hypothetical protein